MELVIKMLLMMLAQKTSKCSTVWKRHFTFVARLDELCWDARSSNQNQKHGSSKQSAKLEVGSKWEFCTDGAHRHLQLHRCPRGPYTSRSL